MLMKTTDSSPAAEHVDSSRVAAIAVRQSLWSPFAWYQQALQTAADVTQQTLNSYKKVMQDYTRTQVQAWLEQDAIKHQVDDGTSAGGRYYLHIKNDTQSKLGMFPPVVRGMLKGQLMYNPKLQEFMRSQVMVDQFNLIDRIIRERYPHDAGTLYQPQYNHRFLTETSHSARSNGEIVSVEADAIVKLFDKKNKGFPHVIVTSSHAQGETLEDVRGITHGIEALARDSEGQELPHGYIDQGVKPGQTLTIYACDVEQTPWLNASSLMARILELKKIAATGEPEKEFNHISPGAKRIAKLMLKCMVEEPAQIDVNDPRPMHDSAAGEQKPIRLRADAVDVAHHFQLIGYSKGGNVVSDAMRYLVSELTAKQKDGQSVFQVENGKEADQASVRNIVRSIAVMALASVEVGLSEHDKAHGVRRVAFNSDKDAISAHHNYESGQYDERWIIKGVDRHVGHAPQDMMGTRALIRGFAHDDPRVARRLKEAFAPNYGKAAIGHVLFNGRAPQGEITIEAATGTTDAQIEAYKGDILHACEIAGLRGADLINDKENPGIFTLKVAGWDFRNDRRVLGQLKKAFEYLRNQTPGLVIAQAIIDGEIQAQIQKAPYTSIGVGAVQHERLVQRSPHLTGRDAA